MSDRPLPEPLLGEWACLGVLCEAPAHGWAVARRLRADGDLGRVWQLSRPLTYRSLDQLVTRGWARAVAQEPGVGPSRVILAPTRTGRRRFRTWLTTPVVHLRDLRTELLLKLVFAERSAVDIASMLDRQRAIVDELAAAMASAPADDVVSLWRLESAHAAQRFLERL